MTNGADALLNAAVASGIEVCFANPGTTELYLVAALDGAREIRPVLTLFEGVAAGAADGYARMAGRPAMTLFHLGPSLGNAIANLHNARRARSPVVVLVGDHPPAHREQDPPLASDIEAIARSVSTFVRKVGSSETMARDLRDAVEAACLPPGHVATLIVPADAQWGPAAISGDLPRVVSQPTQVPSDRIAATAEVLRGSGKSGALLLGGSSLGGRGLAAAGRISRATGCRLIMETFPARLDAGLTVPMPERLAYMPAMARSQLRSLQSLVLASAARPTVYFAEQDAPSDLVPPELVPTELGGPADDLPAALESLAAALDAEEEHDEPPRARTPLPSPTSPLNGATVVSAIAALQPEGLIFVDEGVSSGGAYLRVAASAPSHSYLSLTGGATGMGLPCSIGAAIACRDRKVVAFVGDGSAMYTVQALWTMARESLDILVIVIANSGYRILQLEMSRRSGGMGDAGRILTAVESPPIDWVSLARSMGVAASTVKSTEVLLHELQASFRQRGPRLIEICC